MTTSKFQTRGRLIPYALFAALSAITAAACGDDEDGDDTTTIPGTGGSRPTGGSDAGGETAAGAGNEPGTGGASGGTTGGTNTGGANDGGVGGAGEAGADSGGPSEGGSGGEADCSPQGDYDCYPCAPKTDEQYLNQCSDAECSPFDNAERIPGFTGTLPDL
jgi:hypothetical protein